MFAVVIDFVVFLEQVLISFDGLHAIGFIVHVLCVCVAMSGMYVASSPHIQVAVATKGLRELDPKQSL